MQKAKGSEYFPKPLRLTYTLLAYMAQRLSTLCTVSVPANAHNCKPVSNLMLLSLFSICKGITQQRQVEKWTDVTQSAARFETPTTLI